MKRIWKLCITWRLRRCKTVTNSDDPLALEWVIGYGYRVRNHCETRRWWFTCTQLSPKARSTLLKGRRRLEGGRFNHEFPVSQYWKYRCKSCHTHHQFRCPIEKSDIQEKEVHHNKKTCKRKKYMYIRAQNHTHNEHYTQIGHLHNGNNLFICRHVCINFHVLESRRKWAH